jgi:hypothetical protein
MTEIDIVHFLCSIVTTYIIYKLINDFLDGGSKNKKIEIITYVIYNMLSLFIYFKIGIPIVMLIFNLAFFSILTLNYMADIKRRILTVFYVYSILFIIEMLVAAITGYVYFPLNSVSHYSSVFGEIANQLLGLVATKLIVSRKKTNSSISLPWLYWLCITVIPAFSLYFLVIIFNIDNFNKIYSLLVLFFLLIINFSIMILYDLVIVSMTEKTKRLLMEQQNKYYERQMGLLQTSLKSNHRLQHDLNGHLISIKSILKKESVTEAMKYVDKMIDIDIKNELNEIVRTGNSIIDSILNWKLQEAIDNKINISTKIKIPEELDIDSFNMTIILGNILDNAIEAASKVEENSEIRLIFIYDRRRLMFNVENTFSGDVKMEQGRIVTSKAACFVHGIGLENVEDIVKEYSGTVDIHYDEKWFKVSIMLFI